MLAALAEASWPSSAGLVLDIGGALLLAWGLMFKDPGTAAEEMTPRYGFNVPLELNAAWQTADAQIGAALLVAGFVGQFISAIGWAGSASDATAWIAVGVAVAVDVTAVWFLRTVWRPVHMRRMLFARLMASEEGMWWPLLAGYGATLGMSSDGGVTETVADFGRRVIGHERWHELAAKHPPTLVTTRLRRDLAGTREYEEAHPRQAAKDAPHS